MEPKKGSTTSGRDESPPSPSVLSSLLHFHTVLLRWFVELVNHSLYTSCCFSTPLEEAEDVRKRESKNATYIICRSRKFKWQVNKDLAARVELIDTSSADSSSAYKLNSLDRHYIAPHLAPPQPKIYAKELKSPNSSYQSPNRVNYPYP